MRQWIEIASSGIEVLAVGVVIISVTFGSVRFLLHLARHVAQPYRAYKYLIGRSLLLALEFLPTARRTLLRHNMGLGGHLPKLARGLPLL